LKPDGKFGVIDRGIMIQLSIATLDVTQCQSKSAVSLDTSHEASAEEVENMLQKRRLKWPAPEKLQVSDTKDFSYDRVLALCNRARGNCHMSAFTQHNSPEIYNLQSGGGNALLVNLTT
jgi:hypothetical protein